MAKRKKKDERRNRDVGLDIETDEAKSIPEAEAAADLEDEKGAESAWLWFYGKWTIVAIAFVLRFLFLTLKPFHHDEGVNGFFLTSLFRDGVYRYDPANYHGPTLYYFALLSSWVFGLDDFAVRVVTAVFGTLTVTLVFAFRRYLGTVGMLVAAILIALSPGLVFFSRYFIHETLLLFFTVALVVCLLKFLEGEPPRLPAILAMGGLLFLCTCPVGLYAASVIPTGEDPLILPVARFVAVAGAVFATYILIRRLLRWDAGRPMYIFLGVASAAMMFATKETSFISLGTMAIAIAAIFIWLNYFRGPVGQQKRRAVLPVAAGRSFNGHWQEEAEKEITEPIRIDRHLLMDRLRETNGTPLLIYLSVSLFAYVCALFFSSFFTYENGVSAAFEAYNIWAKTGGHDQAQNGTWAYVRWLFAAETPIVILGFLGAGLALWKSKHRVAMFIALWGIGLLAAYTLIPYKTPWIAINFVFPLALIGGYGIDILYREKISRQPAILSVAILAMALAAYQTINLNFFRFDDDKQPYVYVHSKRSMDEMLSRIRTTAEASKIGEKAVIIITSPDHWPLPWSLHDFKGAAFYGSMNQNPNAEFVIGSVSQADELEKNYASTHVQAGNYTLRPGVDLLLYIRKDLVHE